MLNPIVQKAMEALASKIDLKAGLNSDRDRAVVAGTLADLRASGQPFEPEAIAAWASLNGWTPKAVARVRTMANDVLVGKDLELRG